MAETKSTDVTYFLKAGRAEFRIEATAGAFQRVATYDWRQRCPLSKSRQALRRDGIRGRRFIANFAKRIGRTPGTRQSDKAAVGILVSLDHEHCARRAGQCDTADPANAELMIDQKKASRTRDQLIRAFLNWRRFHLASSYEGRCAGTCEAMIGCWEAKSKAR